ncbi:hypothetical protein A2164_03795 [Candidatus Curtissbacteria bacterium RBG_13_35_7]|uniref:Sugar 3,4-ketoisomerase QdtA cupin domain-containing protein n=1 Tax=Candidatus Curtissbacteria bacterium RBG_13_35_7 TaxID=1797705 RepID=A0A1F5G328_9BACT|nr:MAG: hypothetical protein A2164_03795 [Candidatus Curtissbacteria bacterium RBG_13_35_7]
MSIKVRKILPEFIDQRGKISRIIDQTKLRIKGVLLITSKAKTVRGKHYHKKDSHYVYCLSGKFKYSIKDMKKTNTKIESVILNQNDIVLTQPMIWHSMEFIEDTVFLALTTETRKHKNYEADTIRVELN